MSDSPQSPPKDVDQGAQSPDEEQMNDNQDPHAGAGYEFDGVKEQDRWLPIANGMFLSSPLGRRSRIMIARLMRVELPVFFSPQPCIASYVSLFFLQCVGGVARVQGRQI